VRVPPIEQTVLGFVTLLLFPLLGVVGLLKKGAIPWLAFMVIVWAALGAVALHQGWDVHMPPARFQHLWLVGVVLGSAFVIVAWVMTRPKVAKSVKVVMALIALAVFVRALLGFLSQYA
jgi:hypothetical protein